MPLKYMAGIPEAVKYTGWAHGILFVWYMAVIATYSADMKWPLTKRALAVFAGLFPFGTFWFTRKML
jgi:integral membrane protein